MASECTRVLLVRHGHHHHDGPDPQLTERGFAQADDLVALLSPVGVDAIFSSPMIRALQTAAPLTSRLGKTIRVDRGLCELLAHGWLCNENPLPKLWHEVQRHQMPAVPPEVLDDGYTSSFPEYRHHRRRRRRRRRRAAQAGTCMFTTAHAAGSPGTQTTTAWPSLTTTSSARVHSVGPVRQSCG